MFSKLADYGWQPLISIYNIYIYSIHFNDDNKPGFFKKWYVTLLLFSVLEVLSVSNVKLTCLRNNYIIRYELKYAEKFIPTYCTYLKAKEHRKLVRKDLPT